MNPSREPRKDFQLWFLISVVIFIVLGLIAVPVAIELRSSAVESDCHRLGYPDKRINWVGFGKAYCVKRVEQTDVIVPLDDLKK